MTRSVARARPVRAEDLLQAVREGFEGVNRRLEAIAERLCAQAVEPARTRARRAATDPARSAVGSLGDIGCDNPKPLLVTMSALPDSCQDCHGRKWRERSRGRPARQV